MSPTIIPPLPPPPAPAAASSPAAPAAVPIALPQSPPSPAAPAMPAELLRKLELELAMHAAPDDMALRATYFSHLGGLALAHTGLQTALLPELGAPLYFRGGTPDIAVLAGIFRDGNLAFEAPSIPERILVLGAHAGYAAVALARRFANARVLAVEPLPDNFRLLQLNTAAWPRITRRNVAVWHHPTRLAPTLRLQADWSVRLHDSDFDDYKTVEALGIAELLAEAGWPGAELVLCDASGAERELFANPNAPWLDWLDIALVGLHEHLAPRAAEWVAKALPSDRFEQHGLGELHLFTRRRPRGTQAPSPAALPLLRSEPGLTRFTVADAPATTFGFFVFDGSSCQLHPNPPGAKPARLLVNLGAAGHTRFVAQVHHATRNAAPIQFTAAVQRADGTLAGAGELVLGARERGELCIDFAAPLHGAVTVMLQTAMAATAADCSNAWAHWLDPKLV
jgi:FkbM family methyltransferase